jgi:hypothetical protein
VWIWRRKFLGPAPIRFRLNSPRKALLYRAAEGEPGKRFIIGKAGKIEVLGRGQQLVVAGDHESGEVLQWSCDITEVEIVEVTEDPIQAYLQACASVIGADDPTRITMLGAKKSAAPHTLSSDFAAIASGAGSHVALLHAAGSLVAEGVSDTKPPNV